MIYFTSDLHLGDNGLIFIKQRPFETVEEMNETLINNYNAIVSDDDTVYILGDLCNRVNIDTANKLISRMKGRKYLLRGNHDKHYDPELFVGIKDILKTTFEEVPFVLMHYPLLAWPRMNSGSIQLHGHMHGNKDYNLQNRENGIRRFDVGISANDYKPVSLDAIFEFYGIEISLSEESISVQG